MPDSPERRVQRTLERLAQEVAPAVLEAKYAERDAAYLEGVELGITQVQLAEWAGSTPVAVAKVLRKQRDADDG